MAADTKRLLPLGLPLEEVTAAGPPVEQLLARNPRLTRVDLEHMQQWMSKQPHLPPLLDEELVPFLVSNNYSLERAKECVDKAFTMRTHAPELFSGRDPADPDNKEQLEAFRVGRLPRLAPGGRRLVVLGYAPAAAFDAARFDGARSLRLSTALMELLALEEAGGGGGDLVLVLDAQHVSLAHMLRTPLAALARLMAFVQEAAPLRIAAVHVVRLGPLGEAMLGMVRPLMNDGLKRMTHFHSGDMEEFYKEFPRDILPEDLGGTCGSIGDFHHELVARLTEHRRWLLAQEARVVDEARRPPSDDALRPAPFGAAGSFRQLAID